MTRDGRHGRKGSEVFCCEYSRIQTLYLELLSVYFALACKNMIDIVFCFENLEI